MTLTGMRQDVEGSSYAHRRVVMDPPVVFAYPAPASHPVAREQPVLEEQERADYDLALRLQFSAPDDDEETKEEDSDYHYAGVSRRLPEYFLRGSPRAAVVQHLQSTYDRLEHTGRVFDDMSLERQEVVGFLKTLARGLYLSTMRCKRCWGPEETSVTFWPSVDFAALWCLNRLPGFPHRQFCTLIYLDSIVRAVPAANERRLRMLSNWSTPNSQKGLNSDIFARSFVLTCKVKVQRTMHKLWMLFSFLSSWVPLTLPFSVPSSFVFALGRRFQKRATRTGWRRFS